MRVGTCQATTSPFSAGLSKRALVQLAVVKNFANCQPLQKEYHKPAHVTTGGDVVTFALSSFAFFNPVKFATF